MSSESDAPVAKGDEKADRMDRLRALLNKPIKIPESAPTGLADSDYAAPIAPATVPTDAQRTLGTPPGFQATPTPLSDEGTSDEENQTALPEDGTPSAMPKTSRRTWDDAYLDAPDKPVTAEDVRTELTAALKKQGGELRTLLAQRATALDRTSTELSTWIDGQISEQSTSLERVTDSLRHEAAERHERIKELITEISTLRSDLDSAHQANDDATRKAGAALTLAWTGIALALASTLIAVLM